MMKLIIRMAIAVLLTVSCNIAYSQERYESKAEVANKILEDLEAASRLTPEMTAILESDERLEPSVLADFYRRLEVVGGGPREYCCHNDGTCDCDNFWDCLSMTWACKSGTITCDGDSCTCTEDGPTHCPFENCCTSVGTSPTNFLAGN